jgi:ABC-type nitrate/sulfonate/bicarbonate transport system, ATPase component
VDDCNNIAEPDTRKDIDTGDKQMIKIININKSFGDNKVIRDFSCTIPKNKITAISGASGCGKTTLLRIIMRLEQPDSGDVIYDGKISAVFQEHRLLPWSTAIDNIDVIIGDREKSMKWLDAVELAESANKYPAELSGGMNQRIALARALAYDSDILIMDEPFQALDEELKNRMVNLLITERGKRTVVLVTHEKDIIEKISDNVIYL